MKVGVIDEVLSRFKDTIGVPSVRKFIDSKLVIK